MTARLLRTGRLVTAGFLLALASSAAHALEYRSTGRPAVLYDAPSTAGKKIAIAGSGLPLEVVVNTAEWTKVRDPRGRLAWIEQSAWGSVRNVMTRNETSVVRQQPHGDADAAFRVARGVLLELTGPANSQGWLPVKHASGLTGWVPAHEVWGR